MEKRESKIDDAISKLEKLYDKNIVMKLGDRALTPIEVIPSGSDGINQAIGVGGLPRGRIIEYYGPEGGGKTTLSLLSIAATQKIGGICAFIDMEHSLSYQWATSLGVNMSNLYFCQPDYGEQALTILEELVLSGEFDLIVIDSLAALIPKEELEGTIEDTQRLGSQARMMSKDLRRLTPSIGKSKTVVIFVNQVRSKIGAFYGQPEITPGGRALGFYASIRIRVSKVSGSDIRETPKGGKAIGHRVKVEVKKNKVAPPLEESEFTLIYARGLDIIEDLIQSAMSHDIITQTGNTYHFGNKDFVGKAKLREVLEQDEKFRRSLEDNLTKKPEESSLAKKPESKVLHLNKKKK